MSYPSEPSLCSIPGVPNVWSNGLWSICNQASEMVGERAGMHSPTCANSGRADARLLHLREFVQMELCAHLLAAHTESSPLPSDRSAKPKGLGNSVLNNIMVLIVKLLLQTQIQNNIDLIRLVIQWCLSKPLEYNREKKILKWGTVIHLSAPVYFMLQFARKKMKSLIIHILKRNLHLINVYKYFHKLCLWQSWLPMIDYSNVPFLQI